MNLHEKNILERLRRGDENAFGYIYRTYHLYLYKYAKQILKDGDAADKAVESTFLNLWENRSNSQIATSLKSYLFKSVFNHCLNHIKHQLVKEKPF